jgi:uncharacterized protein YjbI with pentapeptide repeats
MKIIKPQRLSLLTRVFEDDGQPYLVLTAMGMFSFAEPRRLLHEVVLWKTASEQIGQDTVLDAGMSKIRGEVLVAGSAFHAGPPAPGTSVRVKIGSVDKKLYVFGDRVWKTTSFSDPAPFAEMPVTWERAFGGEGFARNPVGKGVKPVEVDGKKLRPLPNIEDPDHLVKSPGDKPEPAGLGPIDQTWPQRMELAGTYDDEWYKTRFPGFAKDFRWEFWNTAPKDQRIDGHFRPDEAFVIEGMTRGKRTVTSRLPGAVARLFLIKEREGGEDELVEATTRLDTVWLFPNIECAVVIFRGVLPVAEDDAADVKHIIAAFEDPASPRDPEHYRAVLARRTDKERGPLHAMIDADLMPPWKLTGPSLDDDWNDMQKLVEMEGLQEAFLKRKADKELAAARQRFVAMGLDPADFDKRIPAPLPPPPKDPAEIPAYLDRTLSLVEEAKREAKQKEAEVMANARATCQDLGLDFDALLEQRKKQGGGPPRFRAEAQLEHMRDVIELGKNAGSDVSDLESKVDDPQLEAMLRAGEARLFEAYRRFAHFFPAAEPLSPEASQALRGRVASAKKHGESVAGYDLTGADLSGMDLADLDLSEALLEGVNLTDSILRGAKLPRATLARATLTRADLSGAHLAGTNFGVADLREAKLDDADLREAVFYQADLRGASLQRAKIDGVQLLEAKLGGVDLSGVRAERVVFLEAEMEGARFVEVHFDSVMFVKSNLTGASFAKAHLPKTCFVTAQCDGASFVEAHLEGTRFALNTSLKGCDMRGAQLGQTLLRGCAMAGADLSGARADDCDFSEADMESAKLYRTSAARSLFVRTNLTRADMKSMNLMSAVLQKTKLHGADLRGANLFRADLAKVRGDKTTRFDDAYLVQIRVVPEKNRPKVVP